MNPHRCAKQPIPNADRFWKFVQKQENGCWLWMGGRNSYGYGQFQARIEKGKFKLVPAHCFAYELLMGPIPEGKVLDHVVCDNRACVNPSHTEPKTNVANVMRGTSPAAENARKEICKNGHALDEENTYRYQRRGREPERGCRICRREARRRYERRAA